MKFARPRSEEPQIGLTPLIDVVFLLLIFFMVTTSFVREAGLDVTLPEAEAGEQSAGRERVTVVVDARDRMFIGDDRIGGRPALRDRFVTLARDDVALRVRADGRASHQAVVTVMDIAAATGIARIDIATQPGGDDE